MVNYILNEIERSSNIATSAPLNAITTGRFDSPNKFSYSSNTINIFSNGPTDSVMSNNSSHTTTNIFGDNSFDPSNEFNCLSNTAENIGDGPIDLLIKPHELNTPIVIINDQH